MIKKSENKMIDKNKSVFECVLCSFRYIGDTVHKQCPACKNEDTFAIRKDFVVTK